MSTCGHMRLQCSRSRSFCKPSSRQPMDAACMKRLLALAHRWLQAVTRSSSAGDSLYLAFRWCCCGFAAYARARNGAGPYYGSRVSLHFFPHLAGPQLRVRHWCSKTILSPCMNNLSCRRRQPVLRVFARDILRIGRAMIIARSACLLSVIVGLRLSLECDGHYDRFDIGALYRIVT